MCVDKISDTPPTFQSNYNGVLSSTPLKVLGRNPHRRLLYLPSSDTIGIFFHFGPSAPSSSDPGIYVMKATPGLVVTFNDWGSAMQQELWATAQSATPQYFIAEFSDASEAAPGS